MVAPERKLEDDQSQEGSSSGHHKYLYNTLGQCMQTIVRYLTGYVRNLPCR